MQISGLSASNTFSATDVLAIEVNVNGTNKTYKLTGATLATALASIGSYLTTADVVNNLTSMATNAPLSAAQGKELNDKIGNLFATVTALNPARSGDVISGGYIKVGKAVIVSFKLTLASNISANTAVVANFQNANISGSVCLSGYADTYGKRGNLFMLRDYIGTLITNTDMEAGNYVFCGCYIAE